MAPEVPWEALIGIEAVLVLVLMGLNLYFLYLRPIRRRIKEISFIHGHRLRHAWGIVIVASLALVASVGLQVLARYGGARPLLVPAAFALQFLAVSLMLVALAITFRMFVRYVDRLPMPEDAVERLVQADMRRAILAEDHLDRAHLDLSGVGDVYSGRKRLGPYVSLTHYRGLTIGFTTYMHDKLGHMGDAILYSVGRLTARTAMADVLQEIPDRENALRRIFDEIRANGIAVPEVVERTEHRIDVRLYENVTSAGVKETGHPLCHYQSGMLTGIFEVLTRRKVLSHEVKCWGLGDRFCEFQLELGAPLPPSA